MNLTLSAVPTANYAEASGVLRTQEVTISMEQRYELVIALEDAVETATEATQQQFLTQLTPPQRQLLEGIFADAMFDAQQAALLLLVLFVQLMLVASSFLPRFLPETEE
ncbi:hypothetical protein [Haladaptatus sp. NG-SE-30]